MSECTGEDGVVAREGMRERWGGGRGREGGEGERLKEGREGER